MACLDHHRRWAVEIGDAPADAAVLKMRSIGLTRSFQPEPENEAARANLHIEPDEFPIAYRMRHERKPNYK